jgi:hypothetical protein
MDFGYEHWRSAAPVECAVNVALLLRGVRRVVQLDMTYYDTATRARVDAFVAHVLAHTPCVALRDAAGNVILCLRADAAAVDAAVDAADSVAFSRMLEEDFYVCTATVAETLLRGDAVVRVSIDVAHDGRAGPLLVQMLPRADAAAHLAQVHACFERYVQRLQEFDPELHMTLTVYTKPGAWHTGLEYAARTLAPLPRVMEASDL